MKTRSVNSESGSRATARDVFTIQLTVGPLDIASIDFLLNRPESGYALAELKRHEDRLKDLAMIISEQYHLRKAERS